MGILKLTRSIWFWIAACTIALAALGITAYQTRQELALTAHDTQLAQIMAIETSLLKKWQQQSGLTNDLTYDDQGDDVMLLQRMLSQDPSLFPSNRITGYYGDVTTAAVTSFQNEHDLPPTGTVGPLTREKLNDIFLSYLCPTPSISYPDFTLRKISPTIPVPPDYVPPGLVEISRDVPTAGVMCFRSDILPHLTAMFSAAQADGVSFEVTSGYRKPEIQQYLYDYWTRTFGASATNEIAKPGFSEHQLGTAVDLTDASINDTGVDPAFADSAGGIWLAAHAYQYGFSLSFPDGKQNQVGFAYEPWHWRYVGTDVATYLHNHNLAFNEVDLANTPLAPSTAVVPPPNVPGLVLSASSFLSTYRAPDGTETTLIANNAKTELPIASVTKIMVALVASGKFAPDDLITVTKDALAVKGASGLYHTGEKLSFSEALAALLIASHNEIAISIADAYGSDFVAAMNQKARSLGLASTVFVNPVGVDPAQGSDAINRSSAEDAVHLLRALETEEPTVFALTRETTHDLRTTDGTKVADIKATDQLLTASSTPFAIRGGKTGDTPRAKMNLVLATDGPCGGEILSVVLGSTDSFSDMKKLLTYDTTVFLPACTSADNP